MSSHFSVCRTCATHSLFLLSLAEPYILIFLNFKAPFSLSFDYYSTCLGTAFLSNYVQLTSPLAISLLSFTKAKKSCYMLLSISLYLAYMDGYGIDQGCGLKTLCLISRHVFEMSRDFGCSVSCRPMLANVLVSSLWRERLVLTHLTVSSWSRALTSRAQVKSASIDYK